MTTLSGPLRTMKTLTTLGLAVALGAGGCDSGNDDPRALGKSSFETPIRPGQSAGPSLGGSATKNAGGSVGTVDDSRSAPPGALGQGATAGPTPAPTAAPRLIEEGDIVKTAGTTLYVLNQYRGLQVIDMAEPDKPRLVSAAPLYGQPLEMYVRGKTVYALVNDYWTYLQCADCPGSGRPFHGSSLAIIDVSNPQAALVTGKLDIEGVVSTSRLVGDVLYTVASRYAFYDVGNTKDNQNQTVVQAINISNPQLPKETGRLAIPRGSWEDHIQLTDKLLYVASSGWGVWMNDTCLAPAAPTDTTGGTMGGSGAGGGSGSAGGPTPPGTAVARPAVLTSVCSRITAIDIGAVSGEIKMGASVQVAGRILDRWNMDWNDGVLRVLVSSGAGAVGPGGTVDAPKILTFKAATAGELTALGAVTIPLAHPETVTATRFDGMRAFVVTFQRIDPLWDIDLSNPEKPFVAGHLETPGWLDHMVVRGNRLLALGHDREADNLPWKLNVSMYDVSDLAHPTLTTRQLFGDGWNWLPGGRDDIEKVFKVVDDQNLVLVPHQGTFYTDVPFPMKGVTAGIQLFDFDLAKGSVTKRGNIENRGTIDRAVLMSSRIVALSQENLQVVDAQDRDKLKVTANLQLARNVTDIAVAGSTAVELVTDQFSGRDSLYVAPAADPDTASPLANLDLERTQTRMFTNGTLVYIVGDAQVPAGGTGSTTGGKPAPGSDVAVGAPSGGTTAAPPGAVGFTYERRVDVVDLGGAEPRKRGSLKLPTVSGYYGGESALGTIAGDITQVGSTLVLSVQRDRNCGAGRNSGATSSGPSGGATGTTPTPSPPSMPAPTQKALETCDPGFDFLVVDLSQPDAPTVAAKLTIEGAAGVAAAGSDGTTFFVDHYEQIPGVDKNNIVYVKGIRFYVTTIDLKTPGKPIVAAKVNVPGAFFGARSTDNAWFVAEPKYDEATGKQSLVVSALYRPTGGDRAYLQGQVSLDGSWGGLGYDGRALFTILDGQLVTVDLTNPATLKMTSKLAIAGVASGGTIYTTKGAPAIGASDAPVSSTYVPSGSAFIRHAEAGRLFVSVSYNGILVYDVSDLAKPTLKQFLGTPGGSNYIRLSTDRMRAYLPGGMWGVAVIDLTAKP